MTGSGPLGQALRWLPVQPMTEAVMHAHWTRRRGLPLARNLP